MAGNDRLHGRKEIAAYVRELYGFGSVGYVSAMIKAGLRVEKGNTSTKRDVQVFFVEHPNFSQSRAYRKHSATFGDTCKHSATHR